MVALRMGWDSYLTPPTSLPTSTPSHANSYCQDYTVQPFFFPMKCLLNMETFRTLKSKYERQDSLSLLITAGFNLNKKLV